MRRASKTIVSAVAVFALFVVPAQAKGPGGHQHGPSHSSPHMSSHGGKQQHGSHQRHPSHDNRHNSSSGRQTANKKNDGGPIFVPDSKTKGGPIFVPESKAQQAKDIHDQRTKNGGPIFVPGNKAQQAKDIHDARTNKGKKSKAEQAKEIHDRRTKGTGGGPIIIQTDNGPIVIPEKVPGSTI